MNLSSNKSLLGTLLQRLVLLDFSNEMRIISFASSLDDVRGDASPGGIEGVERGRGGVGRTGGGEDGGEIVQVGRSSDLRFTGERFGVRGDERSTGLEGEDGCERGG